MLARGPPGAGFERDARGVSRALLGLMIAGCYGGGESLTLDVPAYEYRGTACTPDAACPIAVDGRVTIMMFHESGDTSSWEVPDRLEVDRPDVLEALVVGDGIVAHGRAPGLATLTVHQPGYEGALVASRGFRVEDVVESRIAPRQGGAELLQPDGRLRLLRQSQHTLRVERRGASGEILLGSTSDAWAISPAAATLAPAGDSGVQQIVETRDPETFTVTHGTTSLPIDVVAPSEVASLAIHVSDRPELVARDGETLRLPEHAHFTYVIDAFDAAGRYIAGEGADGDVVVTGPGLRYGGLERSFSAEIRDGVYTVALGGASMQVTLDFP